MFNVKDVEALDYDFSGIFDGGSMGVVPEASTESITAYQLALANLMDTGGDRSRRIVKNLDENDEPLVEEATLSEVEKNAEIDRVNVEIWAARKQLLAELTQGQPSLDEINRLPHRVFLKFEDYVLGKWTPQA